MCVQHAKRAHSHGHAVFFVQTKYLTLPVLVHSTRLESINERNGAFIAIPWLVLKRIIGAYVTAYQALLEDYKAMFGEDGVKLAAAESGPLDEAYVGGGS